MRRLSLVFSLSTALCMVSLFPGGLGLHIHPDWVELLIEGLPEEPKQLPIVAESPFSEWSSSIGLRSPNGRVRVRMDDVPEGLKKPLLIATESMACDLAYLWRQLWDCLAQVDKTWLFRRAWKTMWLLCVPWIALDLWRNVKRPQGQGRGRTASSAMGTDCGEEGTCSRYDMLCRLEATIALMIRRLRRSHRLCLSKLRHERSKAAAPRDRGKKRRVFSSALCKCS